MDDLDFVKEVDEMAKIADWPDMLRLVAMVRDIAETISDAAKENSRLWNWGAGCQAKLETYKVRLAKHEACAEELRAARKDVLASDRPAFDGSSNRMYEALEAIEALLQEDAVE